MIHVLDGTVTLKIFKKKRLDEIELFKSRKRRIYLITDLQQNTYYKYIPLTVRTCIHTYIHTYMHTYQNTYRWPTSHANDWDNRVTRHWQTNGSEESH